MAKRAQNGQFVKTAQTSKKAKLTKVTISAPFEFAKPITHDTYLTGSELDVFKFRMRRIYAADLGINIESVEVK